MVDFERLKSLRLAGWRQTPDTRIADPSAAEEFIREVGMATLFFASPEIPNLYHGYVGDPNTAVSSKWDSPAGHVYGWRWELGRPGAAFYTAIVRRRPTWISWDHLPAVLRLLAEMRSAKELYEQGELSADAMRIVSALEDAPAPLITGDLRREAGFAIGKPQRAAYLKAVEELETRLFLCKLFTDGDEMSHALVRTQYPGHWTAAGRLTREEAMDRFLTAYLSGASYVLPTPLAKHLRLPEGEIRAGLDALAGRGIVESLVIPGRKGPIYLKSPA